MNITEIEGSIRIVFAYQLYQFVEGNGDLGRYQNRSSRGRC